MAAFPFDLHGTGVRERKQATSHLLTRTLIPPDRLHPHNLLSPQRLNLHIHPIGDLSVNMSIWGEREKHSAHSNEEGDIGDDDGSGDI